MDAEIIERLTRIETHLESLVGNGQPGKIQRIEDDVKALRDAHNQQIGRRLGMTATISILVTIITHWLGFHR